MAIPSTDAWILLDTLREELYRANCTDVARAIERVMIAPTLDDDLVFGADKETLGGETSPAQRLLTAAQIIDLMLLDALRLQLHLPRVLAETFPHANGLVITTARHAVSYETHRPEADLLPPEREIHLPAPDLDAIAELLNEWTELVTDLTRVATEG